MSIFLKDVNAAEWFNGGRERVLDLFLNEEYGVRPCGCAIKPEYRVVRSRMDGDVFVENLIISIKGVDISVYVFSPAGSKGKIPLFIMPLHPAGEQGKNLFTEYNEITNYCPVKEIIGRGYAVAVISAKTVAADDISGKCGGIISALGGGEENGWGVLSAWAWACSKVADWCEEDGRFDADRLAVVGHSRGGKTALLAGALDERFILTISNCSGNSGAALSRGNTGETIAAITEKFPYWFCARYKKYAGNENSLPFDQHEFLALMAPRYLYVASATEDLWADPDGELLSAKLAGRYYEMYGVKGLIVPDVIENDVAYQEGRIAYHRRTGKHHITPWDWQRYMDYFDNIR